MQQDNARNTVVFIVCAVALLILYQIFVLDPAARRRSAEVERAQAAAELQAPGTARSGPAVPAAAPSNVFVPRTQAQGASPRVPIDTPFLAGTLSLRGGRIDDLYLKQHRETLAEDSPNVELFRPEGAEHAYFAEFGWAGANIPGLPGDDTLWTRVSGDVLRPNSPVTLRYDNGAGLVFTRRIAVDDQYMFTVSDTVANTSGRPVELAAYGSVQRQGLPPGLANNMILHEGAVGVTSKTADGGGFRLQQLGFKKWREQGEVARPSEGGWFGITDKYWLAALIPDQTEQVRSNFRVTPTGSTEIYEAVFTGPLQQIAPGTQVTESTRLFAGAKRDETLDAYGERLGIPRFDDAIDWGSMFWWITRPVFELLEFFHRLVGNFGVAILLLTVTVKLIFFPLANKSFESMTKMKKLQPQMQALKEKHPDDPAKVQQGMLALYQAEKVNPVMGCLPMLVQIPVFYALYKALFVTIEMRHEPFVGFIKDLSARDPTVVWNLFGLIPWNVAETPLVGGLLAGALGIGVLALIYGLTMWLQQSMNPPAPDPVQQKIFQFFPILFTFIMAPFAAGLLIYWIWNNILTILQQYVIMRRFKVDNPIDGLLARLGGKPKPA
jgi:YidC/Oxa1 family membrane protein insertase